MSELPASDAADAKPVCSEPEKNEAVEDAPEEEPTAARSDSARAGDPEEPLSVPDQAGDAEQPLSAEELLAQRDGYLNDLQRVTAEFANYRRKAAERHEETVAVAAAGIVEKVLPVLDACDAAVAQGAGDVVPIRDALFGALQKEGLAKLDDVGAPFDPNCHEAVIHEPGDGDAVIAEVLRTGYEWNSRVLRPAMVKVRG